MNKPVSQFAQMILHRRPDDAELGHYWMRTLGRSVRNLCEIVERIQHLVPELDGVTDLLVATSSPDGAIVLLGNGDGTFQAPQTTPLANAPNGVAIGDFNGDGIADVAVTYGTSTNNLAILPGRGDGTFGNPTYTSLGGYASALAAADLNRDGRLDLVVHAIEIAVGCPDGHAIWHALRGREAMHNGCRAVDRHLYECVVPGARPGCPVEAAVWQREREPGGVCRRRLIGFLSSAEAQAEVRSAEHTTSQSDVKKLLEIRREK